MAESSEWTWMVLLRIIQKNLLRLTFFKRPRFSRCYVFLNQLAACSRFWYMRIFPLCRHLLLCFVLCFVVWCVFAYLLTNSKLWTSFPCLLSDIMLQRIAFCLQMMRAFIILEPRYLSRQNLPESNTHHVVDMKGETQIEEAFWMWVVPKESCLCVLVVLVYVENVFWGFRSYIVGFYWSTTIPIYLFITTLCEDVDF